MTKKELLQSKKVTLGLSNSMITDLIGFSDRTRRDYMKWNNANDTESEE